MEDNAKIVSKEVETGVKHKFSSSSSSRPSLTSNSHVPFFSDTGLDS